MLSGHRPRARRRASRWRCSAATAPARRRCINTLVGVTRRHGGTIALGGPRHHRAAAARARRRRHRLGAAGAQHLQVADGRREPDRGRAARAVDAGARLRDVPAPAPSAGATWATSSPAASSRCSRSAARWCSTRKLLLLDEPPEGLAPIIVEELLRALARSCARRACRRSSSSSSRARSCRSPTRRHPRPRARSSIAGRAPRCAQDAAAARNSHLGVAGRTAARADHDVNARGNEP